MLIALIKNNLIAIIIHIFICLILLMPLNYLLETTGGIFAYFVIGAYTLIVFLLYFFAANRFLIKETNILRNILSVIAIFIIIFFVTLIAYNSLLDRILKIPIYPLGIIISYITKINEKYIFLVLSLIPSLIMLIVQRIKIKAVR